VRQFKSDGGTEYAPPEFIEYLKRLNTIRQTTCANSPEQNGMSESVWWRLKSMMHEMYVNAREIGPKALAICI